MGIPRGSAEPGEEDEEDMGSGRRRRKARGRRKRRGERREKHRTGGRRIMIGLQQAQVREG